MTHDNIVPYRPRVPTGPATVYRAVKALSTGGLKVIETVMDPKITESMLQQYPDMLETGMVWHNELQWCVTGTIKMTKEEAIASAEERMVSFVQLVILLADTVMR